MRILGEEEVTSLLYEWLVKKIWATDAKVQDVYFFQDGIVEGIQKPGSIRDLDRNGDEIEQQDKVPHSFH